MNSWKDGWYNKIYECVCKNKNNPIDDCIFHCNEGDPFRCICRLERNGLRPFKKGWRPEDDVRTDEPYDSYYAWTEDQHPILRPCKLCGSDDIRIETVSWVGSDTYLPKCNKCHTYPYIFYHSFREAQEGWNTFNKVDKPPVSDKILLGKRSFHSKRIAEIYARNLESKGFISEVTPISKSSGTFYQIVGYCVEWIKPIVQAIIEFKYIPKGVD